MGQKESVLGDCKLQVDEGSYINDPFYDLKDSLNWDGEDPLEKALFLSAKNGNRDEIAALLQHGALVNARQPLKFSMDGKEMEHLGYTPLMYAAQGGYLSCVKLLISSKAEVNVVDEEGVSALHLAAHSGELDVFKALVEAGATRKGETEDHRVMDYLPCLIRNNAKERRAWELLLPCSDEKVMVAT